LGAIYQVCSVSTCNRKRTGLVFCSVACWDSHLPTANHREAWAIEKRAPRAGQVETTGQRRVVAPRRTPPASPSTANEILVISSRVKDYIRRQTGLNTSDRVLEPLSAIIRQICDDAAQQARDEGRKTVLDRDIPKP